ncbi:MAG: hypothetical protein JWQ35_55 [Bacteriovoracaceae bacterium]|nr:hypothetical protein [Bacteriovoracaceae bacterium]
MDKSRLEAFSDGVLAIIITIMVLELKVPHGASFADLVPMLPIFLSYILSFIYVGIYWSNHHHLFHAVKSVNGGILWANLHMLFWLSLTPFVTAWAGENHFSEWPVACYGFVLLMSGTAYSILTKALLKHHGRDSFLAKALGKDTKGKLSIIFYATAIPLAFWMPAISCAIYILVALMWIIPDRRIEAKI